MNVAPFSAATVTGFTTPILRSRMAKSCYPIRVYS